MNTFLFLLLWLFRFIEKTKIRNARARNDCTALNTHVAGAIGILKQYAVLTDVAHFNLVALLKRTR